MMRKILLLDETGAKQQLLTIGSFDPDPDMPEGWSSLPYLGPEFSIAQVEVREVDGELTACTREALLEEQRQALWEDVKAIRESRIVAGVHVPGLGRFDSDPESRSNVAGAQSAALAAVVLGTPEAFQETWTLQDDTPVTLSALDMLRVHSTGVSYIGQVHNHARDLRAAIWATEDLSTIDIHSGWPD